MHKSRSPASATHLPLLIYFAFHPLFLLFPLLARSPQLLFLSVGIGSAMKATTGTSQEQHHNPKEGEREK